MKKIIFTVIILAACVIIFNNRVFIYSNFIHINGEIDIKESFKKEIKPDTMLYIILENEKGTTFAIGEIINPVFPVKFRITRKNVLYPDISTFNIKVYATLNEHGEVGITRNGDMFSQKDNTYFISNRLKLNIDKIKD
jgi:hypothetical protein